VSGRRIETTTSRTAEWTCLFRAASSLESDSHYRGDDYLALLLVPIFLKLLLHIPLARKFGEHRDAQDLEQMYFTGPSGEIVGRINGTHCLVRAIRPEGAN
jgi:hypothetical protein